MAKKKYSINWEDDVAVSFEVDSVQYQNLEDVPDEKDRLKLEAMVDSAFVADIDGEFAKAQKELESIRKVPIEKIILSVFGGIGALMLLIAAIAAYSNVAKTHRELSAPAAIVDITKRLEYDPQDTNRVIGELYYPIVEFTAKDGKRRKVQMTEGSSQPEYEVGNEVSVLYEPNNPASARIKSTSSFVLMWILPGITGLLGIGFLGAVIAVQRVIKTTQ